MLKKIVTPLIALACSAMLSPAAHAQLATPTYGWNLGNTLEATWTGAPVPTQALINSVAAAGFNTIRIPCAWDHHADPNTHQIDPAFMATVTQVVQWARAANLTVIINDHWDGGWFEDSNFNSFDSNINAKLVSYWTQIANNFQSYDSHLLFACANEPNVTTQAQTAVLLQYYQSFINTVRGTGGNNSTRWLVLQGPQTNIDNTNNWVATLPSDPAGHLAFEVHYYAPYQYALMGADATWGYMWYFWGQGYHSTTMTNRNATSAWEESYVDAEFQKMYNQFTSKGIPVLVGEFCATRRTGNPDLANASDMNLHLASRTYFDRYIVTEANKYGLKPVYWDDGDNGSGANTSGIFDRATAALTEPNEAHALTGGAALPPPGGGGIIPNGVYKIVCKNGGLALDVSGLGTANGSNVDQWSYWGGTNQQWTLTHLGNNVYTITGVQSGRALDVYGWGTTNGTNVDIWDSSGGANQQWQITALNNGYYRLTPMNATGECLDVNAASTSNGANIQIWQYLGGNNQQWTFQAP